MYKPHTNSDRRRYVEEVDLDEPIYFWMENPSECGISLSDALHSRVRRLLNREHTVFEGRGPSVSIRLEVSLILSFQKRVIKELYFSGPVIASGADKFLRKISGPLQALLLGQNSLKTLRNAFRDLSL